MLLHLLPHANPAVSLLARRRNRRLELLIRHVAGLDLVSFVLLVLNRSLDTPQVAQFGIGRAELPQELWVAGTRGRPAADHSLVVDFLGDRVGQQYRLLRIEGGA